MNGLRNRGLVGVVFGLVLAGSLLLLPDDGNALIIAGPDIIAAPPSVINNPPGAVNDHQQGFNEQQSVLLAIALAVDGGLIPAGTLVSSHMIFMNTLGGAFATDSETWIFDGLILGVMSDNGGTLEAASSALLGALGTIYPGGFTNRGLETNDSYIVAGNMLTLTDSVSSPGDWIRIITVATPVPEPSTLLLLAMSLAAFAGTSRLRSRRRA